MVLNYSLRHLETQPQALMFFSLPRYKYYED